MLKIVEYKDRYKEKVVDLLVEVILNEFNMNENVGDIKNFDYNSYKNGGGNLWLAVDENDNVIATSAIQVNNEKNEAKLVRVYLNKEYRGTGIATEMLNMAIDFVKSINFNRIILGTYKKLERAVKFYEKNGFKEISRDNTDDEFAKYYALELKY